MRRQRLLLRLYSWELASMPSYETSIPTGTTHGKFWRRTDQRSPAGHTVCMYAPDPDPKFVAIIYFDVELRQGPAPRYYHPPDWSNYQQWRKRYAKELHTA